MSFHVKDDFNAGNPITAVGAEWFNSVAAYLNNLVGVDNVTVTKPEKPSPSSPVTIEHRPSDAVGTPVDVGEFPDGANAEVAQAAETLWTAGGINGAKLLVLFKGESDANAGTHKAYAAKLTISADGRIIKIEAAQNAGMEIMA